MFRECKQIVSVTVNIFYAPRNDDLEDTYFAIPEIRNAHRYKSAYPSTFLRILVFRMERNNESRGASVGDKRRVTESRESRFRIFLFQESDYR